MTTIPIATWSNGPETGIEVSSGHTDHPLPSGTCQTALALMVNANSHLWPPTVAL